MSDDTSHEQPSDDFEDERPDSQKDRGKDKDIDNDGGTYHEASKTESEALRAMMGKKKKADNGDNADADGNEE